MTARVRSPELPQNYPWLNTDHPLSLAQLKGRFVLLDFWTYCCINCLHILPDLKYLEQKYPEHLTVIGVHSAKFDNEKEVENIRQAILRYDIEHPVLVDSSFRVWQQYAVRAWPTLVLIDPQGYYLGSVSGEGHRQALDQMLGELIEQYQSENLINPATLSVSLEKQRQPLTTPLAFPGKVLAVTTPAGDRLCIADTGHHRLIWATPDGEVLQMIGTGQPGFKDGSLSEAQFFAPQGMRIDLEQQVIYVADTENHAIRQINLQTQQVETLAGTGIQSHQIQPHQGLAKETPLNSPWDIEKIGDRLYIAMAGSHQIWVLDLETQLLSTYAGSGAEACFDGTLTEAAFAQPSGLTTDRRELFIADSEGSTIRGVGLVDNPKTRTICGSGDLFGFGDVDGRGEQVRLQHCLGVEYTQNYLWVADTYNHKIKRVDHRTGRCETLLGTGQAGLTDGQGLQTQFYEPSGLSAIASHLYVADTNNHVIREVELDTLNVRTLNFPGLCAPEFCTPDNLET